MSRAEVPLWTPKPERVQAAQVTAFRDMVNRRHGLKLGPYPELHAWSVENRAEFWDAVWDFTGVIGNKGARRLSDGDAMPGAKFFPNATLNFAENLMRRHDGAPAFIFRAEDRAERTMSFAELDQLVSRLQQALAAAGVGRGDRVAAMLPNMPEAVAVMLAVTSLGAIFSSCSPDFGERGVLDRFGQIEPTAFVTCDGYWYGGKKIEMAEKLKNIVEQLPSATVVIVPLVGEAEIVAGKLPRAVTLEKFLSPFTAKPVAFARLPFNHPVYILYSSGTTGVPKCIVHGAGGTLIQHLKEHRLHADLREGERIFYFTTLGWMMWNWLVSGLGCGATLCLYDGSPFAPGPEVLFDFTDQAKIDVFGTSAKYIDAVKKSGLEPVKTHDLSSMRLITSTGSPLAPESFEFVYRSIKKDVHLASISGGTDLVSSFAMADPTSSVWKGELQRPGLGMAVDVWSEDGKHIEGERGELVCTRPFPSMPVMFWNDPEGKKYHAAYFERFPGVWCHGDFAEWTKHGGLIIHGRSDATLNPGGVRIGTAEIYAQVEQIPEVVESIAIGQDWDNDVRIVLFLRLREGVKLDAALADRIKKKIREGASPRHVPAKLIQITDIPRTRSGKITEIAVREVVHGRPVKNTEALANPEALELYRDLPELRT
jgi:acetoacetyl-CoA synthetase